MGERGVTFETYASLTRVLPGSWRERLFARLPRRVQRSAWADLARLVENEHRRDAAPA